MDDFELIEAYMGWRIKTLASGVSDELPRDVVSELQKRHLGETPDYDAFKRWSENQAQMTADQRKELESYIRLSSISKRLSNM